MADSPVLLRVQPERLVPRRESRLREPLEQRAADTRIAPVGQHRHPADVTIRPM